MFSQADRVFQLARVTVNLRPGERGSDITLTSRKYVMKCGFPCADTRGRRHSSLYRDIEFTVLHMLARRVIHHLTCDG